MPEADPFLATILEPGLNPEIDPTVKPNPVIGPAGMLIVPASDPEPSLNPFLRRSISEVRSDKCCCSLSASVDVG